MINCDCSKRIGDEICSKKQFDDICSFFEMESLKNKFILINVNKPYYIGKKRNSLLKNKYYADKWYKCQECGCLWELKHPEFPAYGFVRKFSDGKYREFEHKIFNY